ncbi:metallophosphoesterase [Treponema pectinovorum]|uniref:metallophosphoesterase n=1 Tax=Treponema pectinovorum TaxID=164 RepID=UPI0011C844E0|nr:metallophosphoesterase family protein [Treponema pectinovorum]
MKLLLLSDIHGNTENLEKLATEFANADIVLFGGDFAKFSHPETAKPVLEALTKSHECVFAVIGNCDELDFLAQVEKADISVEASMVFHEGLVIAGSGGGSKFSGDTPFERTDEELVSDFNIVEDSISQIGDKDGHCNNLILIMHNPPKDTACDLIPGNIHVGSEKLRAFIEKTQPLLVLTGHIHESAGIDKVGESTIVNPGALLEGKYARAELEFTDGKWSVEKIELCTL